MGGDCFALVGTPDGKVTGLNASGRAARAADSDWLKASGLTAIPLRSIHAVTVPGAVDGWDALLKRFGTMDLGEALKPAIRLAEEGVPVTPRVAFDWPEDTPDLAADEGGRTHYLKDGRAPRVGESMAYPALAETMRLIARDGRDAFYTGAIAEDIIATVRPRGSLLTLADMAAHRIELGEADLGRFHGPRDPGDPALGPGPHRAHRAQHSLAVRPLPPCARFG